MPETNNKIYQVVGLKKALVFIYGCGDLLDSPISIKRETEFYQGYIRFKMSVANDSSSIIADVTLDFIFDENLLYVARHDDCPVKNGKFVLGNIYGNRSRTFTILLSQ